MDAHKHKNGSISIPTVEIGNIAHEILNHRELKEDDPEWDNACGQVIYNLEKDFEKKGFQNKGIFYIRCHQQLLFVPNKKKRKKIAFEKVESKNVHY